jgi:hypothetical protein
MGISALASAANMTSRSLNRRLLAFLICSIGASVAQADWLPTEHYVYASSGGWGNDFSSGPGLTPGLATTGGGIDPAHSEGSAVASLTDAGGTVVASANSSARADASGVLGITAASSDTVSSGSYAFAVAHATLADVIHFHVPYGLPFVNPILVNMDVHASWASDAITAQAVTLAQASLTVFNPASSDLGHSLYIGPGSSLANGSTATITAQITQSILQSMISNYPQYVTAEPLGYDIAFILGMNLGSFGGLPPGYSLDASHTATFSISTPADVTWDSASGLLLSTGREPDITVPEPNTFALMLFGLVAFAAARRVPSAANVTGERQPLRSRNENPK